MHKTLINRINKVFKNVPEADSIILANTQSRDPNFLYLTGYTSGLFEGDFLIVGRDGAKQITGALEYETAVSQRPEGLEIIKSNSRDSILKTLKEELRGKNVGINEDFLIYRIFNVLKSKIKPKKIILAAEAFQKARLIKDEEEIAIIRKAAGITKGAMKEIQNHFRVGITEKELAKKFDEISGKFGSDMPSFTTIVCFGANASMPHHSPDDTKLKYGDFILIDAGSKVGNYCSDITRTFIFGDDPSKISDYEKKSEMLMIVKEAQRKAISAIRSGVKASTIHNIAEKHINTASKGVYEGTFIHSLGHSLGIEVHDGLGLSANAVHKLEPNMVVTVEPGIYVSGFGGVRIEDDIVVTKNGAMVL